MIFDIPDEHKNASGIYAIKNAITGKVYVGSARHLSKRYLMHKSRLMRDFHHSAILLNSVRKHGLSAFRFILLEHCEIGLLTSREQYWIDNFNAAKEGYNICPIARSCRGIKQSEETIAKRVKSLTGKKHSIEVRQRASERLKGTIPSEATRLAAQAAIRGKKRPAEVVARMKFNLSGANSKLSKPVLQYSLDGTFIKRWVNTQQVFRELGFQHPCIVECANNKRRTAFGFIWLYEGNETPELVAKKAQPYAGAHHSNTKPLLQYSINGDFIKRWDCTADIYKALQLDPRNIRKCARGDSKTAFGYVWKFDK